MGAAHRGNRTGMRRGGQPVVHCGADFAALYRRIARAVMTRDQQQHTLAAGDRLIEAAVDRGPGAVEVQTVEIKHAIGIGTPSSELAIPAAVESLVSKWHGFRLRRNLMNRVDRRSRQS